MKRFTVVYHAGPDQVPVLHAEGCTDVERDQARVQRQGMGSGATETFTAETWRMAGFEVLRDCFPSRDEISDDILRQGVDDSSWLVVKPCAKRTVRA